MHLASSFWHDAQRRSSRIPGRMGRQSGAERARSHDVQTIRRDPTSFSQFLQGQTNPSYSSYGHVQHSVAHMEPSLKNAIRPSRSRSSAPSRESSRSPKRVSRDSGGWLLIRSVGTCRLNVLLTSPRTLRTSGWPSDRWSPGPGSEREFSLGPPSTSSCARACPRGPGP